MSIEKVLYRASATATGGRDGRAVSSDGALDIKLATPRELGGAGGAGTNPEQLFAAGYSACFLGALKFVAARSRPGNAMFRSTSMPNPVGMAPMPTWPVMAVSAGSATLSRAATNFSAPRKQAE